MAPAIIAGLREPAEVVVGKFSATMRAAKISHVEEIGVDADHADRYKVLEELISEAGGCAVLDGGLATELERRGADINDPLWSAKCLLDDEASSLVRQVHLDYFRAGAQVGISASYQATIQGFVARGFREGHAEELLQRSVTLVVEARDAFWEECQRGLVLSQDGAAEEGAAAIRPAAATLSKPLVAASIGSYGAYLADGSEYSGDYGPHMTEDKLVEFHRRRVQVLAAAGPDILAFETIPSLQEAKALVRLLEEERVGVPAWLSFNSKDGRHVVRGDPFEECVAVADACRHVVAVGINCTPPRFVESLLRLTKQASAKPVVVYPNSGETWNSECHEWIESTGATDDDFVSFAPKWVAAGVNLLGGCCRTTPHTIACIHRAVRPVRVAGAGRSSNSGEAA